MAEDLKAVALAAPEPLGRMTEADWRRVEKHAAPQSIEVRLKAARRALRAAQRTADRWEALLALRLSQVEAGTWPPPVERVAWRELRAGDVLLDDPDREVRVEVAETKWTQADGERTTVWFEAPWSHGLCSRSAPAAREVAIRPRGEACVKGADDGT
jgi:FAD/FMN-containing dehydrogenase